MVSLVLAFVLGGLAGLILGTWIIESRYAEVADPTRPRFCTFRGVTFAMFRVRINDEDRP